MKSRRSYPKVLARLDDGRAVRCCGREALTLLTLIDRGSRGISGIDFPGGPAYRLAAYVGDLRGMGVGINMELEEHGIGHHGRYRLVSGVTIEAVDPGEKLGSAA